MVTTYNVAVPDYDVLCKKAKQYFWQFSVWWDRGRSKGVRPNSLTSLLDPTLLKLKIPVVKIYGKCTKRMIFLAHS